jgi:hypothetical protein
MEDKMSNNFNTLSLVAVAALFAAPAAMASSILVDDFSVDQNVQSQAVSVDRSVVSGAMFGGFRYMEVFNAQGNNNATSLNAEGGTLTFNNSSANTGVGYVVYDGINTDDRGGAGFDQTIGTGVNTTGLDENILLNSIFDTSFTFDLSNFDKDEGSTALFSAFAWDTSGVFAQFNEIVGGGIDVSEKLFFSEFDGGNTINWENIGALAFRIDSRFGEFDGTAFGGENFDATVGPTVISTVPLPASALLLLGGLGGFAGLSFAARRRKDT